MATADGDLLGFLNWSSFNRDLRPDRISVPAALDQGHVEPRACIGRDVAIEFQWRATVQHQNIEPSVAIKISQRRAAGAFATCQTCL